MLRSVLLSCCLMSVSLAFSISRQQFMESFSATTVAGSLGVVIGSRPTLASAAPAATEFATSAGRKNCTTISDPSKTIVTCQGPPSMMNGRDGNKDTAPRLQGIAATENGVSTSAIKNPSRFSPPWTYLTETSDSHKAWKSLIAAVETVGATVVEERSDTFYLHATAPTQLPPMMRMASLGEADAALDDLEFVLRAEENLVLYRSASRTSIFVYPLTQPVSDGNTNLKRLQKIRDILGWEELGYAQTGSSLI